MAKFRKRSWAGTAPRPWTRSSLKEEKAQRLDYTCEWCDEKKTWEELRLHHTNWTLDEPGYTMFLVRKQGKHVLQRQHKDGYSVVGTRLVCEDCHEIIHGNPELAEKKGFKNRRK